MDTQKISDIVRPGTRITQLSREQLRQIYAAAQSDQEWLSGLNRSSRKDVLKSFRRENDKGAVWRVALIALNSVTADAALAGTYNEWDGIKRDVLDYSEQPRPFFAVLRTTTLLGVVPVVWSISPYHRGSKPLMRAKIDLNGNVIKVSEILPVGQVSQEYPAVDVYDPTLD